MEKQAKGFVASGIGETFKMDSAAAAAPGSDEKQIKLEISQAKGGKVVLRHHADGLELTGNPLVDNYHRLNDFFIDHTKVKIREKATFFRLLSTMINAGLSLIRSLNTLAIQSEKNPKLAKVLFSLAHSIEGGRSLSASMEEYPEVFSDSEIGVVKAGEASGQLNKTLKSLAEEIEKSASIAGKIRGAMVYPGVLMALLIGVVAVMMIFVVPQMSTIFTQSGKELPLPTQIVIAVSDFFVNRWATMVVTVMITLLSVNIWKKTRSGRYYFDLFKLHLPIFGEILRKGAVSKFARSFSNLMASGVPIIKALEIVSMAIGSEVYKRKLMLTAEDMKRGIPMAENMSGSKWFPRMLVNMIEVGEQTAQLETVVVKVADFYDEEIDNVISALTKVMEPLVLVIIGITVGGIVAAVMLPIIGLTGMAGTV